MNITPDADIAVRLKKDAVALLEAMKQTLSPAEAACVLWMALGIVAGMQPTLETADDAWNTLKDKSKDVFEIGFKMQREGRGIG